jgi:alkanesulfonate monooxygenase SsuD/methylene tetrahydromethanopterin reductase-like flavin-dependent oxidoreductase (luciferase family)
VSELHTIGPLYIDFPPDRPSVGAQWVEDLGYDTLWVGDHVLSYVDGLTAVAAMAGGTTTLTFGTAVYLLALRDPVLVARSLATLSTELPDRFVFGVGVGGDLLDEFEVVGIDVHQRGKRVDAAIRAVRALFDGTHDLPRFERVDDRPAPPIWIGGRSDAAARRAARLGDGFVPYLVTAAQYGGLRGQVEAEAVAVGRDPAEIAFAVNVHLSVEEDHDAAVAAARRLRPYGLSDAHIDRFCVVGDVAECIDGIRAYLDAGAEDIVLNFVCPGDRKAAQVELLASKVLPALRS